MKFHASVCNVLKRLDDYPAVGSESLWTWDEIELYLQDGYDAFCRQTKCVWDMFYPENLPQAGNYVARWELDCFESGMIKVGLINFSGGYWEADYAEAGAIGPKNSTQPWEATYVSVDLAKVFAVSLLEVPEDNVAVDRATYDYTDLEPEFAAWFQEMDRDFQTTSGTPSRFAMDKDGMSWMRIVPAGSGVATEYDTVGTYGILRDTNSLSEYLRTNLTSFWKLNEKTGTRYDSVGNNDLSETGTVGYATGKVDNAASFTDATTYLTTAAFALGQTNDGVTWAGWVNKSSDPVATFAAWASSDVTVNLPWQIRFNTSGQPQAYIRDSGGNDIWTFGTAASICDNDWHLIVVTWNRNHDKKLHLYVDDGSVYDQESTAGANELLLGTSSGVQVGLGGGGILPFGEAGQTSLVDSFLIWDRALSADDIDELAGYTTADPTVHGSWGALREIQGDFPMGSQWGLARRRYSDTANTRVEYFRLGKSLEEYHYEVPERFAKYAEFYALGKALEKDGPGQDLKLSGHFMERFTEGVRRMVLRLSENKRSRVAKIGSTGKGPTRPALARLPWKYGRQIRRGY